MCFQKLIVNLTLEHKINDCKPKVKAMAMDLLDSLTSCSPTGHEMNKQRFKLVLNLGVQTGFTFWTTFNIQVEFKDILVT